MLKKILASVVVLATSSVVLASPSAPYLGFSTGVTTNTASDGGSYRGAPITLLGGYGAIVNQSIYLGGEVFATLGTMTLSNNNAGMYSLKSSYGYGASFMPGVMLADRTMVFARLGLVRTRFPNMSANSNGTQVGLGLETSLIQNWDVRSEYDYTKYNTVRGMSPRSDSFNLGFVYKID